MSKKNQRDKAFAKASAWNVTHRVGDEVGYESTAGKIRRGKTTSTATVIGNQAVLWVAGAGAPVPLERLRETQTELTL